MKSIVVLSACLFLNGCVISHGFDQYAVSTTSITTKEFKRPANMPLRQSELPDVQAKHYRSSSSLKHYSVQQTGDEQYVSRYAGYNGGKDTVVVTTVHNNYSCNSTNQIYYIPQMVQRTSATTIQTGTVSGPSKKMVKALATAPFRKP